MNWPSWPYGGNARQGGHWYCICYGLDVTDLQGQLLMWIVPPFLMNGCDSSLSWRSDVNWQPWPYGCNARQGGHVHCRCYGIGVTDLQGHLLMWTVSPFLRHGCDSSLS